MRKKLLSTTYLRDVLNYNLKIFYKKDYYYSIKEIIEVKESFITKNGLCLINNGYYIMEIIPKNENYCIRIYFDKEKKILEYYIDISLENGIDNDTKIPYYDDLFIDITITNGKVEVLDEDELEDALNNNIITEEEYKVAYKTKELLLNEIENNTNKYLNMDLINMLEQ